MSLLHSMSPIRKAAAATLAGSAAVPGDFGVSAFAVDESRFGWAEFEAGVVQWTEPYWVPPIQPGSKLTAAWALAASSAMAMSNGSRLRITGEDERSLDDGASITISAVLRADRWSILRAQSSLRFIARTGILVWRR